MKHIAVVVSVENKPSDRPHGDWAAWVGNTEEEVVVKAMTARRNWEERRVGARRYDVYAGTLTKKVSLPPINYVLDDIEPKRKPLTKRLQRGRKF